MITIRKSNERGHANHGWLDSHHTFSFADYYDPQHMGYSVLRVINEDHIAAGQGFGTHGHRDMEIITYVIEGSLKHKDSMGNSEVIRPGEVQRMSAGTGVQHSEHSDPSVSTHLLQIWILPEKLGVAPSYEQKQFANDFSCSDMILVASRSGRANSVTLNQDVDLYVAKAQAEGEKHLKTFPHRHLWIQVVSGEVRAEGATLGKGDGAAITGVEMLVIQWTKGSEFLVFDMP
ncbi:MAG: pirin family protein [Bacteriovoracia bacterium]